MRQVGRERRGGRLEGRGGAAGRRERRGGRKKGEEGRGAAQARGGVEGEGRAADLHSIRDCAHNTSSVLMFEYMNTMNTREGAVRKQ
jgi:hypothetical protein